MDLPVAMRVGSSELFNYKISLITRIAKNWKVFSLKKRLNAFDSRQFQGDLKKKTKIADMTPLRVFRFDKQ